MKRIVSSIIALTLLLSLCSCGGYTSSYKAVGLVRNNTSHSCQASFLELEGRLVFKLRKSASEGEGDISYTVTAEEGEITLFYDAYGIKEELARVRGGDSVSSRGGYVEGGRTVYIIIEATEDSHGKVSCELSD